jgi:hypothetical protein
VRRFVRAWCSDWEGDAAGVGIAFEQGLGATVNLKYEDSQVRYVLRRMMTGNAPAPQIAAAQTTVIGMNGIIIHGFSVSPHLNLPSAANPHAIPTEPPNMLVAVLSFSLSFTSGSYASLAGGTVGGVRREAMVGVMSARVGGDVREYDCERLSERSRLCVVLLLIVLLLIVLIENALVAVWLCLVNSHDRATCTGVCPMRSALDVAFAFILTIWFTSKVPKYLENQHLWTLRLRLSTLEYWFISPTIFIVWSLLGPLTL